MPASAKEKGKKALFQKTHRNSSSNSPRTRKTGTDRAQASQSEPRKVGRGGGAETPSTGGGNLFMAPLTMH